MLARLPPQPRAAAAGSAGARPSISTTGAPRRPLLGACSAFYGEGGGAGGGGGGGGVRPTRRSSASSSSRRTRPAKGAEDGEDGRRPEATGTRRRTTTSRRQPRRADDDDEEEDDAQAAAPPPPPPPAASAVQAVVKSAKKLRRGPFAGLISELHADMVSAPPPKKQEGKKAGGGGGLALPGGPNYSALRRHIAAPPSSTESPADQSSQPLPLVVVEGDADAAVVHCSLPHAPCYVCDGTRAMRPHARPELDVLAAIAAGLSSSSSGPTVPAAPAAAPAAKKALAVPAAAAAAAIPIPPQPRPVELVVLTDPDERGRELRAFLDEVFASSGARARHAFVPEAAATLKGEDAAATKSSNHAAGNRGIEHAAPRAVRAALDAARPSYASTRRAFTPEWARESGLAGAFEGAPHDGGEAAKRRRALCAKLGLGQCSVAQLLSALNRYFDEETVEKAIKGLK